MSIITNMIKKAEKTKEQKLIDASKGGWVSLTTSFKHHQTRKETFLEWAGILHLDCFMSDKGTRKYRLEDVQSDIRGRVAKKLNASKKIKSHATPTR